MAIFHKRFSKYVSRLFKSKKTFFNFFDDDPVLALADICHSSSVSNISDSLIYNFGDSLIEQANDLYKQFGFVGIVKAYFEGQIVDNFADKECERKIYTLKKGMKALPATKAVLLLKGFGHDFSTAQIKQVYCSYGMGSGNKRLMDEKDFLELNHRVETLSRLIEEPSGSEVLGFVQDRFEALWNYSMGKKSDIIKNMPRTLFYLYLQNVQKHGMLGLFDKNKQVFRESKITSKHEAHIVLHKIQNPERSKKNYINYLAYNGIKADRTTISKLFTRWGVSEFKSAYVSNLKRLEEPEIIDAQHIFPEPKIDVKVERKVNENFHTLLKGMNNSPLYIDAPGLMVLWYYLEKLDILSVLTKMNYIGNQHEKYSWFEYFLYTLARIFYGIPTYGAGCNHQEPSLCFFTGLIKPPPLSCLLDGLSDMTEKDVFELQKWLIAKLKALNMIQGKRIAFDFKQIDLDVENSKLRKFGKGPSPKKKICYNGFRPHIAWDLDTKNLMVIEFRKSSARGTTTIRGFIREFLTPVFNENFEQIYIDSEYTGKDVWNFILDGEKGMGADLIGCLKQNKFVAKKRDEFLIENQNSNDFWKYWDEKHVYSSSPFTLTWEYKNDKANIHKTFSLNCVVKKNIVNGSLRCFGSSWLSSTDEILKAYSHRWEIENAIKDLGESYFLNKIPTCEKPNLVNIHFLIVAICKHLYQMIVADTGDFIYNANGSIKTLKSTREMLFRQGSAKIIRETDTINVHFSNRFTLQQYNSLQQFYEKLKQQYPEGLKIMGGLKLKFILQPPHGDEYKNSFSKTILTTENF